MCLNESGAKLEFQSIWLSRFSSRVVSSVGFPTTGIVPPRATVSTSPMGTSWSAADHVTRASDRTADAKRPESPSAVMSTNGDPEAASDTFIPNRPATRAGLTPELSLQMMRALAPA